MKRIAIRRLAVVLVVVAALAVVALVAYYAGTGHQAGFGMRGMGFRGGAMGWGYAPGFGLLGLLGFVLVGVLVIWLVAALASPDRRPPDASGSSPADVERLRELTEMHTRGELTDEEFTAAKARLLSV